MLKDLKWDAVERAYDGLVSQGYKPGDYLVLLIRPNNDGLKRRIITVEHFKVSMWHLYNSPKQFTEIAAVDRNGDNSVLFHYGAKHKIDEGMPTSGDGSCVQQWNEYDENRREALLKILTSQIIEETDARTD